MKKEETRRAWMGRTDAGAKEEEEEWLWRPDSKDQRVKKDDKWKEAVLTEQQVIWDAIKRGGGATGARARSHTSAGHHETDGFASDNSGTKHQGPSSRKVRWATDLGTPAKQARPSTHHIQPAAPTPATKDGMLHKRWIPRVNDFAADVREEAAMREQAAKAQPRETKRTASVSGTGDGAVSDSGSVAGSAPTGGWRDWRLGAVIPESMRGRRAHTPMPMATQTQSPRVRARTVSEVSRDVPAPGGRVGGVYQQQLEDMAARLRRELSISS